MIFYSAIKYTLRLFAAVCLMCCTSAAWADPGIHFDPGGIHAWRCMNLQLSAQDNHWILTGKMTPTTAFSGPPPRLQLEAYDAFGQLLLERNIKVNAMSVAAQQLKRAGLVFNKKIVASDVPIARVNLRLIAAGA